MAVKIIITLKDLCALAFCGAVSPCASIKYVFLVSATFSEFLRSGPH